MNVARFSHPDRPHTKRLSLRKALSALCFFSIMSLCSLASQSAHAGQWVLDHCELSGSDSITNWWYWGPSDPFWFNPTFTWPSTSPDGVAGGAGYCDASSSKGSVTAVFRWSPSYAGEAPSKQFYIRVNSYAYASTVQRHETAAEYAAEAQALSVDNGFDDPITGDGDDYETEKETHGQHTLSVDATGTETRKTFHISASGGRGFDGWNDSTDYNMDISVVDYQPKSVMIGGAGGTQEYVGGEWKGKGDTRFSNDVYDSLFGEDRTCVGGENFGPVNWSAGLIGSPWPPIDAFVEPPFSSSDQWTYDTFTRNWSWSGAGSDSGNTYDIHSLVTQRPHVNWPYKPDQGDPPRDLLEQMDSPRVPPTQTQQVTLTLTDADAKGQNPQWNFNGTAQSTLTFHNEYELIQADHSVTVPPTENPWIKLLFKGTNSDIQTPGQYNSWSPNIYYEAGTNWDFHVNGAWWSGGGGGSTNQGMNASPPPTDVPLGFRGVVFGRPSLIRIHFTYNHFLVGGREIPTLNPDGSEIPFGSQVVRPRGGFGTNDIDLKVFTFGQNDSYPGVIYHD